METSMHRMNIPSPVPHPSAPHDSDDRRHQCASCPLSFKRREHYQRHLRSHTKERPFTCKNCSKTFSRKDLVLRHIRKLHTDGEYLEMRSDGSITTRRYIPNSTEDNDCSTTWSHWETTDQNPFPLHHVPPSALSSKQYTYNPTTGEAVNGTMEVDSNTDAPARSTRARAGNIAAQADSQSTMSLRHLEPRPAATTGTSAIEQSLQASLRLQKLSALDAYYESHFREEASGERRTGEFSVSMQHDYDPESPELVSEYLKTFFDTFNLQMPLIHASTFDCAEEPRYLVLAMAAIGAMHKGQQKAASTLYNAAEAMFASNRLGTNAAKFPRSVPLADARTLLLLVLFGAFNGNRRVASKALNKLGKLSACYEVVAQTAKFQAQEHYRIVELPWNQWRDVEAHKRLLHCTLIFYSLLLATYGTLSGLNVHDMDVELPSPEAMWRAATEEQWRYERNRIPERKPQTVGYAVGLLFTDLASVDNTPNLALEWSSFGVVVVMHVLALTISTSSIEPNSMPTLHPAICTAQSLLWSIGLTGLSALENSGPEFAFGASVALKIGSIRQYSSHVTSDRASMLRADVQPALSAVRRYRGKQFPRSQTVTEAMAQAFESLISPGSQEILMVRLPSPLQWSLEHLVAVWDTVVILSKWLHTVQADGPEIYEQALMNRIAQTLQKNDWSVRGILAADLCRFWATSWEGSWFWAVSTRMVSSLKSLGDAYEQQGWGET